MHLRSASLFVVGCLIVVGGCHLAFPFETGQAEGRDAAAEANPVPDLPHALADRGTSTDGPPGQDGPPADAPGTLSHGWSKRFGGSSIERCTDLALDGSGNVYITGAFIGAVDFGGGALANAGVSDIFVASYSAAGKHRWSRSSGGSSGDQGRGVAADGNGDVFVTGYFTDTADFGGGGLASVGTTDIFVASYAGGTGGHRWSKAFGDTLGDWGNGVAADASGNIFVTGFFKGAVDFGGGSSLAGAGGNDIFVASYTPAGEHRWSSAFGGSSEDWGNAVAADSGGNVYATGYFNGTVDFGGGALVSAGGKDVFVASYTSAGKHRWSRALGGTLQDEGYGIAVDGSGNVHVTGYFNGTVDFGGGALVSAGLSDIFVASYTSAGSFRWARRFGSPTKDSGNGVAVDTSGNVYATGHYSGTVDLGGGGLACAGSYDIFVASYTSSGKHRWSRRYGASGADYSLAVAVDGSGNVYLAGTFEDTVDFGGGGLTSAGSDDIFLLKLVP